MTRITLPRRPVVAALALLALTGPLAVLTGPLAATARAATPASVQARPASVQARPASVQGRPAVPSSRAAATPTPGMDAPQACASRVSYSVDGRRSVTAPLPAAASRVGGAALADPGLHVTTSAGSAPPRPHASAWMVTDLGSGQVLAACNAHVPLAPASTLKVLTALALHPLIEPGRLYRATDADARVDGTRVGLVPGSVYRVDDLWHGLLMSSGNDAATAVAAMAGGDATASAAMDRTAAALGAADTRVHNTSGLDLPGQVSSAYDLALYGRATLGDPALVRLVQTRSYAFPEAGTSFGGTSRKTFEIQNHNRLLYNYPGALGVKNGWTSTSGGSFIGAAQRGGRRIEVTLLAADPPTWHMSAALLDWAFTATPASAVGVGRLVSGPDPDGALPAASPGAVVATGRSAADVGAVRTATGPSPSAASPPLMVGGVAGAAAVVGLGLGLVSRRRVRRGRRDHARIG
jgi:D-alanyl-D-alanine carboxypeptidase (penicillin-binding protein 5/6)